MFNVLFSFLWPLYLNKRCAIIYYVSLSGTYFSRGFSTQFQFGDFVHDK